MRSQAPLRGKFLAKLSILASPEAWLSAATVAALNLALALSMGAHWTSAITVLAISFLVVTVLLSYKDYSLPGSTKMKSVHHVPAGPPPASTDRLSEDRAAHDEEFDEDLELTVWVGKDAEGDRVLENRLTRPHHAINGRALTLIWPYAESDASSTPIVPELTVDAEAVGANWFNSTTPGRGVVLFDTPVSEEPIRWNMSYRVPGGLWNPLRSIGLDVLRYDVRQFQMGRFSVRFIVDGSARDLFVQEHNGRGMVSESERDADGNVIRIWTSEEPAAPVKYEWDLSIVWDEQVEPQQ